MFYEEIKCGLRVYGLKKVFDRGCFEKIKPEKVQIHHGFHNKGEEKLDKDQTKARKCDINSRTPTWISSDTKWSVN